jgi:hypothetical protein
MFIFFKTDYILKIDISLLPWYQIVMILALFGACYCFFPQKGIEIDVVQVPKTERKLTKRTLFATLLTLDYTIKFC